MYKSTNPIRASKRNSRSIEPVTQATDPGSARRIFGTGGFDLIVVISSEAESGGYLGDPAPARKAGREGN